MEHILKALNDALSSKEYNINYLEEENIKLRSERNKLQEESDALKARIKELEQQLKTLQTENKSLKNDLTFYQPTEIPTIEAAKKEDF